MDKLVVLLALLLLSSACIGGSSYTFEGGMAKMNAILEKYESTQDDESMLSMRGELFDLRRQLEEEEYSKDVGALMLILQFRINFIDARMAQGSAKGEMEKFGYECLKISHFELAQKQYEEFIFYSNEAAANLEALIEAYPEHAQKANIDSSLVENIKNSSQLTQRSLDRSKAQVEKACA